MKDLIEHIADVYTNSGLSKKQIRDKFGTTKEPAAFIAFARDYLSTVRPTTTFAEDRNVGITLTDATRVTVAPRHIKDNVASRNTIDGKIKTPYEKVFGADDQWQTT